MYNALLSGDGFFMYLRWFVFNAPDDYRFRSANIAFIIIKLYLYMCISIKISEFLKYSVFYKNLYNYIIPLFINYIFIINQCK